MNGKTSSVKKRVKSEEIGKHRDFGKMKMPRHGMKDSIRNRWRSEFASDLCLFSALTDIFSPCEISCKFDGATKEFLTR